MFQREILFEYCCSPGNTDPDTRIKVLLNFLSSSKNFFLFLLKKLRRIFFPGFFNAAKEDGISSQEPSFLLFGLKRVT